MTRVVKNVELNIEGNISKVKAGKFIVQCPVCGIVHSLKNLEMNRGIMFTCSDIYGNVGCKNIICVSINSPQ